MTDKTIGFTTRYNAYWKSDNRPDGYTGFNTDGEALTINDALKADHKKDLGSVISYANLMFYD